MPLTLPITLTLFVTQRLGIQSPQIIMDMQMQRLEIHTLELLLTLEIRLKSKNIYINNFPNLYKEARPIV